MTPPHDTPSASPTTEPQPPITQPLPHSSSSAPIIRARRQRSATPVLIQLTQDPDAGEREEEEEQEHASALPLVTARSHYRMRRRTPLQERLDHLTERFLALEYMVMNNNNKRMHAAVQTDDVEEVEAPPEKRRFRSTYTLVINRTLTGGVTFYWIPDDLINPKVRNELETVNNNLGLAIEWMEKIELWPLLARMREEERCSDKLERKGRRISNTYFIKGTPRRVCATPTVIIDSEDEEGGASTLDSNSEAGET